MLPLRYVIIALFAWIVIDVSRGRGFFAIPRIRLGSPLLVFGSAYLGVMVIRYVVRMSLYPPERWTGSSIPIFFHWVLASYLLTVARFHIRKSPAPAKERRRWIGGVFCLCAFS